MEAKLSANQKTHFQSFQTGLEQEKEMEALEEKLAEAETVPSSVLYDNRQQQKKASMGDVAKQGLQTGMYCDSEYRFNLLLPCFRCRRLLRRMRINSNSKSSNLSSSPGFAILNVYKNESEAYAESEAYHSASVVPIHTRSELYPYSDSAYDPASVASVNQSLPVKCLALVLCTL